MHRTFKQDCNATIKFKLSCDKQWLEVIEMNLTHNHETDQRTLHHLPQQRKHDESINCSLSISSVDLAPAMLYLY